MDSFIKLLTNKRMKLNSFICDKFLKYKIIGERIEWPKNKISDLL